MWTKNGKRILQIIFYSIITTILYLGLSNSGEATDKNPFAELSKITEVIEKQKIELTDWTLYTSEHLNRWDNIDEIKDELTSIQTDLPDFNWGTKLANANEGINKTIGTLEHKSYGITETLTYNVVPHKKNFHSYLTYEVKGIDFSDDINQSFSAMIQSRLEVLFSDETEIFTLTTGINSDDLTLNLEQQTDRILTDLTAQKIEFLKEETFISVSAYTTIWNNAIKTNNQKMNLQVAIRLNQRSGDRIVTIGTPIITTEY